MSTRVATTILLSLAAFWSQGTYSAKQSIYPLITYKCDPQADIVVVTNSLLSKEEGKDYNYNDEDGTYSPWDLVEISRDSDEAKIVHTTDILKTCKLSSGEYTIVLEPHIFSRNLKGSCGASISGAITVLYDDFELLERTAFDDYCHGNAPVITRVTVFGKTSKVKIKKIPRYKFY